MRLIAVAGFAVVLLAGPVCAQQVELNGRPVLEAAVNLKIGEYVWAPQLAPDGPMLAIVNLRTQRLVVFRNGVPIAASTVSSGKTGHETPTGVFTILQKNEKHFSRTYDNAPMPNMQRLTWRGIALHAGNLPGYPASHGCVRLPLGFSKLLFGTTSLGMTVVITDVSVGPRLSSAPELAKVEPQRASPSFANAAYQWHADRGKGGIVSVVAPPTSGHSSCAMVNKSAPRRSVSRGILRGRSPMSCGRETMRAITGSSFIMPGPEEAWTSRRTRRRSSMRRPHSGNSWRIS
jgi:hypothetical protein